MAAVTALLVTVGSGLAAPTAPAQSVASLRTQAAQLEARIQKLGQREAALSERYDGARYALTQTEAKVTAARRTVRKAQARAARARGVLQNEAIDAYVSGTAGSDSLPPLKSANQSLLRAEYEQTLANSQANAMDAYKTASMRANTDEHLLRRQEASQAKELHSIAADKAQVQSSAGRLHQLLANDKGRIATVIAQQQAAARRAAQRAARRRLQQQRARQAALAAAQATTTTTQAPAAPAQAPSGTSGSGTSGGSGGSGFTPPASSSAAQIAVAAAESRVGDPYVWGAAGPSSFDCSGLVMWAYAQAGISLPHFSGAQYADTVHIPMSDIQPGDLLFMSNPDQHVAMYVGNGMIIQAPYTGADVQIIPLYSELTLASRVE